MELFEIIAKYAEEYDITKFEAGDIDDVTGEWAKRYARDYHGTFSFMLDMQRDADRLSKGQAKGVLNCALAEARYNKREVPVEEVISYELKSESFDRVIPNGTYTVVFPDQTYRTIRLRDDFRTDGPENAQVAQFLSGSDNDRDFTGFAFVHGQTPLVWKNFRQESTLVNALNLLLESPEAAAEYGYAYALESERCYRCGRTLTVPASISRGLGPECAKALGS